MPTASISTARACGEPANPAERPEPVALWTCRFAWTTRSALPTCPQQSNSRRRRTSSRDSRLTTRLHRCQKPDCQNASRPGRHQIGTVGEIISESWARSNRYTRARSSESAYNNQNFPGDNFGVSKIKVQQACLNKLQYLIVRRIGAFAVLEYHHSDTDAFATIQYIIRSRIRAIPLGSDRCRFWRGGRHP